MLWANGKTSFWRETSKNHSWGDCHVVLAHFLAKSSGWEHTLSMFEALGSTPDLQVTVNKHEKRLKSKFLLYMKEIFLISCLVVQMYRYTHTHTHKRCPSWPWLVMSLNIDDLHIKWGAFYYKNFLNGKSNIRRSFLLDLMELQA